MLLGLLALLWLSALWFYPDFAALFMGILIVGAILNFLGIRL